VTTASEGLPPRSEILDRILDRVHPPVARFRIISNGLARNHTLNTTDDLSGTRACLSCGNCVDACPVVASKPEGTMFVRTSMLLENVVADECRRCYRCVAACPQISRPLKDYVRGFRRIERLSHWDALASYLVLMSTGIAINHWGAELPPDLRTGLGLLHRLFTIGLVMAPIILFLLDRHHFNMIGQRALHWSPSDLQWFRAVWDWMVSGGKKGTIKRGAFNPGQRLWYIYVPAAIVIFAVTGIVKWIGPQIAGEELVRTATGIHVSTALLTDILLLLHVYLKLIWPVLRDVARGTRQYLELEGLRRKTALSR